MVATKKHRNPWNYLAQRRKYQTSKLFGTTQPILMGLKILEKTVEKAY